MVTKVRTEKVAWVCFAMAIAMAHVLAWMTWHCAPAREQGAVALLMIAWGVAALVCGMLAI